MSTIDSYTDTSNPEIGGGWAWLVCLSAGLFFFYEFFQLNVFDVINDELRLVFHLDASKLSLMSSGYLLADILFLIPAGLLLDKYSTKKIIISTMLLCVIGTVGFGLANSFLLATVFHFLSGVGHAFCFLSCVVLISRWFPPNRQALAIGAVVTMAFLGGTMAHTPLAYLRDHFGWREALIIDGIVGILLIVWISFFVKDSPLSALEDDKPPISNKLSLKKTILTVVKKPQNILAGLYTSLLNLPIMVLCALWGDSYLQHVHHVPPLSSSMIVSLIFLGSMIGCPLMGYLSDRQGKRKPLMWFGSVATFLTLFPLFIFHSLTQTELSMIFCLLGFFTSTQVISYPLIAESNPAYLVGVSTSVASVIIMGGGGLAQVFFGYLMNLHAGSPSNYSSQDYGFAMCLFPLSILVTFIVLFFIKETNCQHQ